MNFSKKYFFLSLLLLSHSFFYASQQINFSKEDRDFLFNEKLSYSDEILLTKGNFIFNSIGKIKNVKIKNTTQTKQVIETVQKVNPNHLIEIIKFIPYTNNTELIKTISLILQDISVYTEIPYYSTRNGKTYQLFKKAEILSMSKENGKEIINERLLMSPFKSYTAKIEVENPGDYYFYTLKNTERVKYKFLNAIKPEKMIAGISVFKLGDNWVIYALGGAYVFHGPFFSDFVEEEFCGRIKSFVIFMFQRLESRLKEDEEN